MGAKLSLLSTDLVMYLKQTEESTVNFLKKENSAKCLIMELYTKYFPIIIHLLIFSTFCVLFPIFKFGNLCFPGKSFISSRFHSFCMA